MLTGAEGESPAEVLTLDILSRRGKTIRPKTLNQKRYVDAIDSHTIVFGIGPAGTGKTYLAMAKAVSALQTKQVSRIILTRPAVEAGERLGFLPGTLSEKIDPYLRPLYDALHDMMDPELIPKLMAPGSSRSPRSAYMRGRAQPLSTRVLTPSGFRPIGECGSATSSSAPTVGPTEVQGRLSAGLQGDLSRLRPGRCVDARIRRPPVVGVHPRRSQARQAAACTGDQGDDRQPSGGALPPVRVAAAGRAGRSWKSRSIPMDPYALGLLLGDGCITCTTTPSFATRDPELAESLEALVPGTVVRRKSEVDYVINRIRQPGEVITLENPVTGVMRRLGLAGRRSHDKFVPQDYLMNAAHVRLAVLQGLLDTDGGPVTQSGRTCRIQYTTISDRLRDDVVFLVRSLGGVAYARTRPCARP